MSPELICCVEKVLEGFDQGIFIRDATRDGEMSWGLVLVPYLVALGKLKAACLAAHEGGDQP